MSSQASALGSMPGGRSPQRSRFFNLSDEFREVAHTWCVWASIAMGILSVVNLAGLFAGIAYKDPEIAKQSGVGLVVSTFSGICLFVTGQSFRRK